MVEIGDALEIQVVRHWGRGQGRPNLRVCADMKIYHDGSVVVWADEPSFSLRRTSIVMKDGEAAWDTIARAIATAKKAAY